MQTRARYIGTAVEGQYRTALVDAPGNGWVYAQFDEWGNSNLHHGWHLFPQRDFADLEGYDPLPPIPEGPFEEPVPQWGRQVFYGRAMSNRELDAEHELRSAREFVRRTNYRRPARRSALLPSGWAERAMRTLGERNPCAEIVLESNPIDLDSVRAQGSAIIREVADHRMEFDMIWSFMNQSDEELAG